MLLEKLSEYADRLPDLPPPMYQPVQIRYIIRLDEHGNLRSIPPIDRATKEEKRGKIEIAPDLKRAMGIKPKLLVDNAEYVLGLARETSRPERVIEQHAAFCALVRECANTTGEPSVRAVAQFLDTLDIAQLQLDADFDRTANIGFQIGEEYLFPFTLPAVKAFWARKAGVDEDQDAMQCLVCGQQRPAVERLPIPIKGIPGGQATGMALISANSNAFFSYGLEASLIAPTCEDCGQRFGNALNRLIRDEATHITIAPVVYLFWTKEEVGVSFGSLFSQASTTEVKALYEAPWRSRPDAARIAQSSYYATALSASGARVVVRDWIETTLENAQAYMERYFNVQRLIDFEGKERFFPLWQLIRATMSAKSKHEEPAALVGQAIMRLALRGDPLPEWLLYQVVRRLRAEQNVTPAHVALIKMVLLTQSTERNDWDMAQLDTTNPAPAYLCGRLLAMLDTIQYQALGDVNAGIVDRYYGTASSAPASVFGRLVRGAQPHLAKIQRDNEPAYIALDRRLQEILEPLTAFPATLTLRDQGLFALGFYHQRAADSRARLERRQAKAAAVTETNA